MNYFESEPMRYFSPPASMNSTMRQIKLKEMINSNNYCYGLKTDGNWSRAIITPTRSALQTRGISKITGTYGEIQDKVIFWNDVLKAFSGTTTVILGEVFRDGEIDRQIGSILRCLAPKALERQKNNPLHWRIFDVLCYNNIDLMNTPFQTRIKYISEIVKKINSPLVEGVTYYPMTNTFFDEVNDILAKGLEGVVCYKNDSIYIPGKRGPHAWDTCKVKQEISSDIDCFITDVEKPTKLYTGKELTSWPFWEEARTGKLVYGEYFGEYRTGGAYTPVTKNYYYNYPGAIYVSVFNHKGDPIQLCKVAGLTDELKTELRDNFEDWYMCPLTIGGMMVSTANAAKDGTGISIRHPYIKRIRKDDLNPEDCTLEKIIS